MSIPAEKMKKLKLEASKSSTSSSSFEYYGHDGAAPKPTTNALLNSFPAAPSNTTTTPQLTPQQNVIAKKK